MLEEEEGKKRTERKWVVISTKVKAQGENDLSKENQDFKKNEQNKKKS